eukprot:scaffold30376_cov109-Isochrysis_galbana.AAC.1
MGSGTVGPHLRLRIGAIRDDATCALVRLAILAFLPHPYARLRPFSTSALRHTRTPPPSPPAVRHAACNPRAATHWPPNLPHSSTPL